MRCEDAVPLLLEGARDPALAAHVATCADCGPLAADLARLDRAVADLPREVQPSRDLFPGIAARIRPRTTRWAPARWLAAAVVLVAASSWTTAQLVRPDPPPALPAETWEQEMVGATAELRAALDARRADLDPATLATVEQNLALIDRAIAETRTALDADPEDRRLRQALVRANEQKISLLRRALALHRPE